MEAEEPRIVLLVEDNPGDADLTTEYLAEGNVQAIDVRRASNLGEAIVALTSQLVDAVILDLNLPDSTGLDTLIRVRAVAGSAAIIVLSGMVSERMRADAMANGAEDVLGKDEAFSGLFSRSIVHVIERDLQRRQQRQLEALLEANPDAMIVMTETAEVRYANRAAGVLFDRALTGDRLDVEPAGRTAFELSVVRGDDLRLCEVRVAPVKWRGEAALLGSIRDLTELKRTQAMLETAEAFARNHALRLESLLAIVNDRALNDADRWTAMLEHAASTMLPGQRCRAVLTRVAGSELIQEAAVDGDGNELPHEGDAATPRSVRLAGSFLELLLESGAQTQFWEDFTAAGPRLRMAVRRGWRAGIATKFIAAGNTWVLSFVSAEPARRGFGEQERAYVELLGAFFASHVQQNWQFERLRHQQAHDLLTGLLNRSQFRSQVRVASREHPQYAIVKIDLSDFREINEAYGHMIGDALLVEVASALQRSLLPGEIAGRVGGDVFAVYVPDAVSRDAVRSRAQMLSTIFSRPFSTGDRDGIEFIALTASLGIAIAPDDGERVDAVMSHADAALVTTKRRGQGAMLFFERGMEGDAHFHATLRTEITSALERNEFELYFQPHVNVKTGAVAGCEALLRWNHPERGILLPGVFIPFAERAGLIASIDDWVMRRAFVAAAEFAREMKSFCLYFNLSGRQAGSPDVAKAFAAAAAAGVPVGNVGVEITESDAMRDVIETRRVCQALRELGVRVAIDDFGTGYSSLSSLKQLPIDTVKIDQSFVAGLPSDAHDAAIAETIVAISKRFGFTSLAEGAETPEQIAWLRDAACDFVQGFGVCHPLPLAAFQRWLHEPGRAV